MKKWLENVLYHYGTVLLIAVLVLAAGGYMLFQQNSVPEADYTIGVVCPESLSSEETDRLRQAFEAAAEDVNGDGRAAVQLRVYRAALGSEGQDPTQLGALDADLVGKVSGIFLLSDPAAFDAATGGLCTPDLRKFPSLREATGLEFAVAARPDHPKAAQYTAMLGKLAGQ